MQTEKEREEAKCSQYEKNSNKKQTRSQGRATHNFQEQELHSQTWLDDIY